MKVPLIYSEISVPNKDPRRTVLDKRPFTPQFNFQDFSSQDARTAVGKNIVSPRLFTNKMLKGKAIGGDADNMLFVKSYRPVNGRGLPESKITGRKPSFVKKGRKNPLDSLQ